MIFQTARWNLNFRFQLIGTLILVTVPRKVVRIWGIKMLGCKGPCWGMTCPLFLLGSLVLPNNSKQHKKIFPVLKVVNKISSLMRCRSKLRSLKKNTRRSSLIILWETYKLFSFFICFIRQKHRGIVFIEMSKTYLGCRLETQVCLELETANFWNREDTILGQYSLISTQPYAALSDGSTFNSSVALRKKWSFPLTISSVNVTKSAGNYGFGHIFWRNL